MPATPYIALPTAPARVAVSSAARHLVRQLAAVVLYWLWLDSTRRVVRQVLDRLAVACAVGLLFLVVRGMAVALILWQTEVMPYVHDVVVPFLTAAGVAAAQL